MTRSVITSATACCRGSQSGFAQQPRGAPFEKLPERFDPIFAAHQTEGVANTSTKADDRKSFLATPLFLDADFWVNLPVYTDHQVLGINGSLVNATLWNASNTARFFRSPANAPAAVNGFFRVPSIQEEA